jgi:hypothetical protein
MSTVVLFDLGSSCGAKLSFVC